MTEGYHGSPSMEAVILAGGYGRRMDDLTKDNQKCLLPIDGEPTILQIIHRLLKTFGSLDVKIGVAYQADKVIETVKKLSPNNVRYSFIPHTPGDESEGAYRTMQPYTNGGVFLCMPGDVIADSSLYDKLLETYAKLHTPVVLAGAIDVNEVTTHGLMTIVDDHVVDMTPPPPKREAKMTEQRDMGIFAADKRMYDISTKYPSPNKMFSASIRQVLEAGEIVGGVIYDKPWVHLADAMDLNKSAQALHI